ncbi:hypothetical protein N7512_005695 [Penicillium capsulatum]|nr:hypothetical protein N7512_005695 [Penicillium capsulatum]
MKIPRIQLLTVLMWMVECLFDAPPDGVLRGQAYVATLEARIKSLEKRLRAKNSGCVMKASGPRLTPATACSDHQDPEDAPILDRANEPRRDPMDEANAGDLQPEPTNLAPPALSSPPNSQDLGESGPSQCSQPSQLTSAPRCPRERRIAGSDVTVLDILHGRTCASNPENKTLPDLPPSARAKALVDTVYFYTQARYCIVDWAQLREWHREREAIAYVSTEGPVALQTGAFFIWIIYAIGDCLVPNPENSTEKPTHKGTRDLVGLALRLCIKLRYHRKAGNSPATQSVDPHTLELQKRFFWCAYCFDRLLGIVSKLPFGISDYDIDVEIPIDIDDTCTDRQMIRELQLKQAAGETRSEGTITTVLCPHPRHNQDDMLTVSKMTAALHHLQVYRIRSRILSNFTGPHARMPSLADVERLLSELDQWRQQAPRKQHSRSFPQQNPDRVQANYFQAVLLLLRPILIGNSMDPALIQLCVEFAADACESAKTLSLNPLTLPDRITVYHCFYGGITLLQCLAINPGVLSPRRSHQAISACLSALAVYTRVLPAVAPFLRLFEDVSNLFVCNDYGSEAYPSSNVRSLLNRIVSSDPSETSQILQSLSGENNTADFASIPEALEDEPMTAQFDSILGGQSSVVPLEMPLDISPLYAPDAEIMDLWTGPWLDSPSI